MCACVPPLRNLLRNRSLLEEERGFVVREDLTKCRSSSSKESRKFETRSKHSKPELRRIIMSNVVHCHCSC